MVLCPLQGKDIIPVGIFSYDRNIFLVSHVLEGENGYIRMDASTDGFKFEYRNNLLEISDQKNITLDLVKCQSLKVSHNDGRRILTYKFPNRKTYTLNVAVSKDFTYWKKTGKVANLTETGVVVSDFKHNGKYVMYFGEGDIGLAESTDLKEWVVVNRELIKKKNDFYGINNYEVGNAFVVADGIILLYYSKSEGEGFRRYKIKSLLFDKNNPGKVLKSEPQVLFETPQEWGRKTIEPIGVIWLNGKIFSYWASHKEGIYAIEHNLTHKKEAVKKSRHKKEVLKKSLKNPILAPNPANHWESRATFNPAAVYEDKKVHLVYRAIGDQDVSVLGYATSCDGVHVDKRHNDPIYVPSQPFESSSPYNHKAPQYKFASGGGCFGGCEDPRITKVDDKFYMTYVAYNGWAPPRVALTSIKVDDFLKHNWNWDKPVLISKPGVVDKNAAVLPEKINGKYVVFHRIFPNILIDYVDDMHFDGNTFLKGEYKIEPNYNSWDSRKVGVGAPPIKTEDGWLVIYHAVGDHDSARYKMGAMVLDHNDPTKVLYRTKSPILEPREWYENEGYKSGVAYPCGAVAMNDMLHVYYGGADTVVCVASANIHDFLNHIKQSGTADLVSITG
jgi:beta-1,2-mannobiose phosphorylase / 1,2-beta-oligomannan phosphorylase